MATTEGPADLGVGRSQSYRHAVHGGTTETNAHIIPRSWTTSTATVEPRVEPSSRRQMNGDTTPPAPAGINDGDWPGEFAQSGGARRIYEGDEAHHGVIDDVAALSDHGGGHAVPLIPGLLRPERAPEMTTHYSIVAVGKDATPASPDPGIRRAEQSETSRARGKGPRLLDRDAPFRQSYGR